MQVLLFGDLLKYNERFKELIREQNRLCQAPSLASAKALIQTRSPEIIFLADTSVESRELTHYIRSLSGGDAFTIIAFARPEEADSLYELRDAGVDECILESLYHVDRLRIRLAFVNRMASEKLRRRQIEEELEDRVRQEEVLNDLIRNALLHSGSSGLYSSMIQTITETVAQNYGFIVRAYKNHLRVVGKSGFSVTDYPEINMALAGDALHREVIETGAPVIIPDFNEYATWSPPDFFAANEVQSGIILPLPGNQNDVIGTLSLFGEHPHSFTTNQHFFLETAASILSGLILRLESEAKSETILKTTIDGIITIDEDGYVESFNQAAEKLFGYSAGEIIGGKVNLLMPEPYRSEHDTYLENYKKTGVKKIIGIGREVTGLHKNGQPFPMYLAVNEMSFNGRRMFTGIVSDISQQRQLEQELLQTSEHERRRIGQDLHDGLGQMLTGVGLMARQLEKSLKKEEHKLADKAAEISGFIKEADQYARQLSRGLLPVDIDERGLATAFNRLMENAGKMFQIDCRFHEHANPVFEETTAVEQLYRVGQEAVNNAVKHGNATKVDLILDANDEYVTLIVRDNGRGFPDNWRTHAGMGMKIMQFRVRLLGGSLEIDSPEDGHTTVRSVIPKHHSRYYLEA